LDAAADAKDASLKKADLEMAKDLEAQLVKARGDIRADRDKGKDDASDIEADSATATRLQAKLAVVQADISADLLVVGPIASPPG
jgi:hypothetical protein